jgi:hypothetical protein
VGQKPLNANLGAMYRPLILHAMDASVYHIVVNAFPGTKNLQTVVGSSSNTNLSAIFKG